MLYHFYKYSVVVGKASYDTDDAKDAWKAFIQTAHEFQDSSACVYLMVRGNDTSSFSIVARSNKHGIRFGKELQEVNTFTRKIRERAFLKVSKKHSHLLNVDMFEWIER